jgi:hypothetical protein
VALLFPALLSVLELDDATALLLLMLLLLLLLIAPLIVVVADCGMSKPGEAMGGMRTGRRGFTDLRFEVPPPPPLLRELAMLLLVPPGDRTNVATTDTAAPSSSSDCTTVAWTAAVLVTEDDLLEVATEAGFLLSGNLRERMRDLVLLPAAPAEPPLLPPPPPPPALLPLKLSMDNRFLGGAGRAILVGPTVVVLVVPPLPQATDTDALVEADFFLGSVRFAVILLPDTENAVGGEVFVVVPGAFVPLLPRLPADVADDVADAVGSADVGFFVKPTITFEDDDVAAFALGSATAGFARCCCFFLGRILAAPAPPPPPVGDFLLTALIVLVLVVVVTVVVVTLLVLVTTSFVAVVLSFAALDSFVAPDDSAVVPAEATVAAADTANATPLGILSLMRILGCMTCDNNSGVGATAGREVGAPIVVAMVGVVMVLL